MTFPSPRKDAHANKSIHTTKVDLRGRARYCSGGRLDGLRLLLLEDGPGWRLKPGAGGDDAEHHSA
jgi:hypothetical protein